MANLRDRVQAATATTGTGSMTMGAATAGYRSFAAAYPSGQGPKALSYVLIDGAAWETGVGTYDPGTNTLTRGLDASSTGSILNLSGSAIVSVAYLSRDNTADWPFVNVYSTYTRQAVGGFTTLAFNYLSSDSHGGWDFGTNFYTVPQTGIYSIELRLRFDDGTPAGQSVGVGVHTSNNDGSWFLWTNTLNDRDGRVYLRTAPFAQGDQLRAFGYTGNNYQVIASDMSIFRIR